MRLSFPGHMSIMCQMVGVRTNPIDEKFPMVALIQKTYIILFKFWILFYMHVCNK